MGTYLRHVVWLPVAILLGVSLATANYVMLFATLSLIVLPIMLSNVKIIIYALLLTVTFFQWFYDYLGWLPRQLTWIQDILCILLLLRIVFDVACGQIRLRNTFITSFVYLWLALAIIGIVVNAVSPPVFIAGFRNYFRFIPLLLVFSWYPFPEAFVKRVIHMILLIGFIQIPIVIIEYQMFQQVWGDEIVGSFGKNGSGILAIFELVLFLVLLGLYKSKYYSPRKLIIYSSLVLASSFVTEAKIVFYLIPALMLLYLIEFKKERLVQNVMVGIFGAAILLGGLYTYNRLYSWRASAQSIIFSEWRVLNYLGIEETSYYGRGRLNRIAEVRQMYSNINKDPFTRILGVGIGNASDSLFQASRGRYHKMYPNIGDDLFAARLGWEFGYAGFILLGVFFLMLCRVKRHKEHGTFYEGMFYGVRGLVLITVATFMYNSFLTIAPLAMLFWVYLGIVNSRLLMEKP